MIPVVPPMEIQVRPQRDDEWILVAGPTFGLCQIRIVWQAGAGGDGSQAGLSALAWEMVSRGTRRRNRAEFARAMELLGADLGMSVSRSFSTLTLRVLEEFLEPALDLIAEALTECADDEDELDELLVETSEGIEASLEEPDGATVRITPATLWTQEPWSLPVDGLEATRESMEPQELAERRQQMLGAPAFFGVGAEDPETVLGAMERFREKIRAFAAGEPLGPTIPEPRWNQARIVPFDAPQGVLTVFSPLPSPLDPRWPALALHATRFGDGFSSPLIDTIRTREGLSYDVSWWLSPEDGQALHVFRCHPEAERVPYTLSLADRLWAEHAQAPLDEATLEQAKAIYCGARLGALETVSRRLANAIAARRLGDSVSRLWELPARVAALSMDEVLAVAPVFGWARGERSVIAATQEPADAPEWGASLQGLELEIVPPEEIE